MRKPTAEQKLKAQARREKMRALTANVAKMTAPERAAVAAKCPVVTIEGRSLSLNNQCLLALQMPAATIVGGFRQWIKAGRAVKKGEHGACIWIPLGQKDENGSVHMDDEKRFMLATVFDVSQTAEIETGAPVAEPALNNKSTRQPEVAESEFEPLAA